jgi:hypothetical protein
MNLPYVAAIDSTHLPISSEQETRHGKISLIVGQRLSPEALGARGDGGGVLPSPGTSGGDDGTDVWCTDLTILLPIGAGEPAILGHDDGVNAFRAAVSGWEARAVGIVDDSDYGHAAAITFTPRGDGPFRFDGNNPVVFVLDGIPINRTAGNATLGIRETASTVGPNEGYAERTLALSLPKASGDFHFRELRPVSPVVTSGTVPTLTWEGTPHNTTFNITWSDDAGEHTVQGWTSTVWSPPADLAPQGTATYVVEAVHTPDGSTTPLTPAPALATTVQVIAPQASATVARPHATTDETAVLTTDGNIIISGDIIVKGNITADGAITAKGAMHANNSLYVDGDGSQEKGLYVRRICSGNGDSVTFKDGITVGGSGVTVGGNVVVRSSGITVGDNNGVTVRSSGITVGAKNGVTVGGQRVLVYGTAFRLRDNYYHRYVNALDDHNLYLNDGPGRCGFIAE